MAIDFIRYRNPNDTRITGQLCDEAPGDLCDVYMEVCVSAIGKRDCSFFNVETDVIAESDDISFSFDLGGEPNPLIIDLKETNWTVRLHMTLTLTPYFTDFSCLTWLLLCVVIGC